MKNFFNINDKFFYLIIISLFFHIIAAYFSEGFYQQDEHFSILEPINFKLGKEATLGWDFFHLYDRQWILSYFFYLITNFFSIFNITSPFKLAFIFRLFSSILGWLSIICLINISKKFFSNQYSLYTVFFVASLFWFYPYFHSRPSSENISCSLLIFSITYIIYLNDLKNIKIHSFFIGIILGFSFLIRYTNLFLIAFLGLWTLLINKNKFKHLLIALFSFSIIFLIGVIIDYWGYNKFTLSSLNYFLLNYEWKQMNYFPTYPWWYNFYLIIKEFLPPISILVLFSFFVFWFKFPKNILTWTTLPYFIFLTTLGHKETRYLFPILIFTPIFFGGFVEFLIQYGRNIKKLFNNYFIKFFLFLFVFINFIALITLSITPANNSTKLYKFLYKNPYQIEKLYILDKFPYKKSGLLINYYRNDDIDFVKIFNKDECPERIKNFNLENKFSEVQVYSYPRWNYDYYVLCNKEQFLQNYIFTQKKIIILISDLNNLDFFISFNKEQCRLLYNSLPLFMLKFNYNHWINRISNWYVFECNFP